MSRFQLHERISDIPAPAWDALAGNGNPFLRHAFLAGLERTGCLRRDWGWTPLHAALWEGERLVAAAPAYLKTNSHGEFVFDHAWAHAWQRQGLPYYPKWLCAVPYTPVTGPRLLADDEAARASLIEAMRGHAREAGLSGLHVNFLPETEAGVFGGDWLEREDVQFHWRRDPRWRDFQDFADALDRRKRKNLLAERRKVTDAGIELRIVHGDEAGDADLAEAHALYCLTFTDKGNAPALTLEFFRHLAQAMPRALVLVLARQHGETVAAATCLRGPDRLYGRYWGSRVDVPGLHFETCYHQGIAYCLDQGIDAFEPGAQGEHKLARGFLPVLTRSRHWVAEAGFVEPLRAWCAEERAHARRYAAALAQRHNPYRVPPALAAC